MAHVSKEARKRVQCAELVENRTLLACPPSCPGDNIKTARFIAAECGIYTPGQWPGDPAGGLAMEGPTFRALSDQELQDILPRLQVGVLSVQLRCVHGIGFGVGAVRLSAYTVMQAPTVLACGWGRQLQEMLPHQKSGARSVQGMDQKC